MFFLCNQSVSLIIINHSIPLALVYFVSSAASFFSVFFLAPVFQGSKHHFLSFFCRWCNISSTCLYYHFTQYVIILLCSCMLTQHLANHTQVPGKCKIINVEKNLRTLKRPYLFDVCSEKKGCCVPTKNTVLVHTCRIGQNWKFTHTHLFFLSFLHKHQPGRYSITGLRNNN